MAQFARWRSFHRVSLFVPVTFQGYATTSFHLVPAGWGPCSADDPPVEDHMMFLCCFVMFCIWLRGAVPNSELNGVFVQRGSSPEERKRAHGCLKQACQDVRGGPVPAHPTRQLLPASRPSTNNLLWEEVSVCSDRVYSVCPILSERSKEIT